MTLTSEEKRLEALFSYNLMDTKAEKQYDHITKLACYICGTKMAAINLIDGSRLWIKSKVGFDMSELSKDLTFCKYTILQQHLLEIPDTLLDDRLKDNPAVSGENGIRYYAGISLVTPEGYIIGTICVFDTQPNLLNDSQQEALQFLADETVLHMETAKRNHELQLLTTRQNEFKALFDNSGDLHFISDETGKIEFINSSVKKILGYQAEEVLGRSIRDFCVPDDQFVVQKMQESLARGENKVEFLVKVIAKNLEIKWFSFFNVNLNKRWLSNGRDVTKNILAEQELQQLSLVASHVTNGMVINDENNKILWVNEAFETITGYNLKDVKGEKLSQIITGKQTDPQILDYAEKQVNNKTSFTIELLAYTKKQEQIWLSVSNSVILDELGETNRSIEIIKDVTERKQTDIELQTLSAAVTKSSVGVMIRNGEDQVIWMNNALEEILGWQVNELKGSVLNEQFIGELTDLKLYREAQQQLRDKKSYDIEIVLYKKDKIPIWLSVFSNLLLNSQGQVERQLSIFMDITLRKKAEHELIHTREQALQLSRAKETFISVLSHEIRSPINAVIGISRVLMEENPTPAQLENLNILKFSSENLLKLVNDILDFTKIETGNMQLESAAVNLKQLARQTLHTVSFKLENKDLKLNLALDPAIPELVLADSTRLYQIMMNLLGNAVKFTTKGEVKLSLDLEKEDQESVLIKFCVSDTGIGIPHDRIKSIFEVYSQASSDTTRKYGGTGLGLTITQKLIELHQSAIEVKSEPGKGSDFYFRISFKKAPAELQQPVSPVVFEALKANVLVADDNQINLTLAKKILTKWGIEADFAANGLDAYEMAMVKDYDLILMDLHMPVMDGLEATKIIRKQPQEKYKTVPIIALTGSVFGLNLENLQQEGLTDHFLKPYTPEGLYNKIKLYLKPAVATMH